MNRFRIGGMILCSVSVVLGLLFILGLLVEEWRFWIIAAPVIVGFLGFLTILFMVGRLLSSTHTEATTPQAKSGEKTTSTSAS